MSAVINMNSSFHSNIVREGHKPVFNIIAADSSATAARVRCLLSPRLASRNRTFQPPSTPYHPSLYTLNSNGGAFTVLLINWVQPNSLALDFGFITFYSYLKRVLLFFFVSSLYSLFPRTIYALMVLMFYDFAVYNCDVMMMVF